MWRRHETDAVTPRLVVGRRAPSSEGDRVSNRDVQTRLFMFWACVGDACSMLWWWWGDLMPWLLLKDCHSVALLRFSTQKTS